MCIACMQIHMVGRGLLEKEEGVREEGERRGCERRGCERRGRKKRV